MTDTTVTPPPPAGPPLHALVTAGVLLLLYVGLTIAMIFLAEKGDGRWEHALLIYNGFTAFAVAAGGVLLGTQIQQANVTAARREATEAKSESDRVKLAARAALAATHAPSAAAGATSLADVRDLLTRAI